MRPKINLSLSPSLHTKNTCIQFLQYWTNVEDVGPTLYKYYINVLCLLGYSIHQNVLFKKYWLKTIVSIHNSRFGTLRLTYDDFYDMPAIVSFACAGRKMSKFYNNSNPIFQLTNFIRWHNLKLTSATVTTLTHFVCLVPFFTFLAEILF